MSINPIQAPVNYLGMMPQVDLAQSFSQLGQVLAQRRAEAQAGEAKAQFAADLDGAQKDGSQSAWLGMIAKYPQFREAFDTVRKGVGEERVKNEFNQGFAVSTALENGRHDVAANELRSIIAAKKNSGESTAAHEQALGLIEAGDPESVKAAQGGVNKLLAVLDPDRYKKAVEAGSAAPMAEAKLKEAESTATIAAAKAKFAESEAATELSKKNWDITKIQEDIAIQKENARIAAVNSAISRETNDLKRQELGVKLQEMQEKRDTLVREKAAQFENAATDIDNFLNTAERIIKTPNSVLEAATGPISTMTPTLSQDTANFEELINTLSSQAFISQIPKMKGSGQLSDAEGKKLQAALQSLSLRQSPDRLLSNVKESQRLLLKVRNNIAKSAGMPASTPDMPAAAVAISTPDGQNLVFPNKAAADAFRKAAGL
jgi:hypothetical protein